MHPKLLRSSSPKHARHGQRGSASGEARDASHITGQWDQGDYARHRSFQLRGNLRHTLKAGCERAPGHAGADESSGLEKCGALRSAIVVHGRDWGACERSLATC